MSKRELDPQQKEALDDFINLVKAHKTYLTHSVIRAMIVKPVCHEDWRLHFGFIDFVADSKKRPEETLEYDSLKMVCTHRTVSRGVEIVRRLVEQGQFDFGRNGRFKIESRFSKEQHGWQNVFSSSSYMNYNGLPTHVFKVDPRGQDDNVPHGPFLSLEQPSFTDYQDAASFFFKIPRDDYRIRDYRSSFNIRVADYRGKIEKLLLSSGSAVLEATSQPDLVKRLRMLVIAEGIGDPPDNVIRHNKDIPSLKDPLQIPVPCNSIQVYLIDKKDCSLVDHRSVNFTYAHSERDPTVKIEHGPDDVEAWLQMGENQWIEFKAKLDDDDFLETVVSFANGVGGRILIGVNDKARVVGYYDEKGAQRVEGIVQGRVDPVPSIESEIVDIHGKPILLVTVPSGQNPPYILRERGIFIRSSSTDRTPTRAELDEILKRGGQLFYR